MLRAWMLAFGLGALLTSGPTPGQEPVPAPLEGPELNVLWILGEDLGPELGCYGTPEVRTPHLDRLAAEGMRFTRAFSPAPVCSPSRSGIMTGMNPTSIGAHHHRSHREDGFGLPEGVRILSDWLRPAGVLTANLRDLGAEGDDAFIRGTGKTDWNFHVEGEPFDTDRWGDLSPERRFFAQVNFPETHRGRDWNRADQRIETPADPTRVSIPPYYPDCPEVREDWAQYLNAVMALDRRVGFVLDALESSGLADRTVVVFFGDHGRAMVRGKQWPYDSGLHVPLIVRWPSGIDAPSGYRAGETDERLVSLIDVSATTLATLGVPIPGPMEGRPLFGPNAGPPRRYVFASRGRCDETVFDIRTVRGERYRYLRNRYPERPFLQLNRYKEWSYPTLRVMRRMHGAGELEGPPAQLFAASRAPEELYDLLADPHEVMNLAGDPAHAEALERMRGVLDAWIVESGDAKNVPEPQEVHAIWEARLEETYGERLRRRAEQEAESDQDDEGP